MCISNFAAFFVKKGEIRNKTAEPGGV